MSAANPIVATRQGSDVLIVDETFRIAVDTPEFDSQDGQTVVLRIECGVRCADSPADRQMLGECFLGDGSSQVMLTSVEERLARQAMPVVRKLAAQQPAQKLVDDALAVMADPVRKALDGAAFSCGLEVVAPLTVSARSPSLDRQRKLEQTRARQEEVARLQRDAVDRAGELARQVEQLKATGGKLSSVLAGAAAVDRGELVKAAFLTCADAPATLRIAAGSLVVSVDATRANAEPATLTIGSLGALRSVRQASVDRKDVLLLGARGGVCVVDPLEPSSARQYPVGNLASEFGFNAVALLGRARQLVATHAQVGVVAWDLDAPLEEPRDTRRASDAQPGGRCVLTVDDGTRAVFAGGGTLYAYEISGVHPVPGTDGPTIVSIVHVDDARFAVVRDDGSIDVHDAASLDRLDRVRRGGRVTSAATIECLGAHRLLLAGDEGPVQMVGVDDESVIVLGSTITGWRDVAAHNGRIAAVTGDRQRVVLWNAWEPAKPFAEVHVAATVRHRVADIAFG